MSMASALEELAAKADCKPVSSWMASGPGWSCRLSKQLTCSAHCRCYCCTQHGSPEAAALLTTSFSCDHMRSGLAQGCAIAEGYVASAYTQASCIISVLMLRFWGGQVLFKSQGKSQNEQKKAVDLEDIKFHQCVRLTRFETDRTISFIPPDGSFDLMVSSQPGLTMIMDYPGQLRGHRKLFVGFWGDPGPRFLLIAEQSAGAGHSPCACLQHEASACGAALSPAPALGCQQSQL